MVEDFRALHFRTVGASHIKANKVCQDYAQSAEKQGLRYAAVCDGHGGADYFRSDRGSRFAAKCFAALMDNRDFTDALHGCVNEKARGEIVGQFVKCLICRWNSMVDDDIEREP